MSEREGPRRARELLAIELRVPLSVQQMSARSAEAPSGAGVVLRGLWRSPFVLGFSAAFVQCGGSTSADDPPRECTDAETCAAACGNGVDDDADGVGDCADPDCAGMAPNCMAPAYGIPLEDCANGVDDDGDGDVDCADADCRCLILPELEWRCDDGADDDDDGLVDCDDPECAEQAICGELLCDDGTDDDADGLVDCDDPECVPHTVCGGVPFEICDSGIDDDGDGLIDCSDPDCSTSSGCISIYNAPFDWRG